MELGKRLPAFRTQYGLTQKEVARVVGASDSSVVVYWEKGVSVPDGIRRERLIALLDGKLWPELRAALISGGDLPKRWDDAVRWYRRLSRERTPRAMIGARLAIDLERLRQIGEEAGLREQYCVDDVAAPIPADEQHAVTDVRRPSMWQIKDAAYGLRWLEVTHGLCFDLRRSLVP